MTTHLLLAACAEAVRARSLFPKTDHLALALAEEAGEVVKAALDLRQGKGTAADLRKELVQCIAMCIRLGEEGDAALGIPGVCAPDGPHDLYTTSDADAPASIRDSNGEVVLGLCKRCRRGEAELVGPCVPRSEQPSLPEAPRYLPIPESGNIIRRCETCGGLTEVPAQLSQVGITGCRACTAENAAARRVAIMQQFLANISRPGASAFAGGFSGEQLRAKAQALSQDFNPDDFNAESDQ